MGLYFRSGKPAVLTAGMMLQHGCILAYPLGGGDTIPENSVICNYGVSKYPVPHPPESTRWLNHPSCVKIWMDKVKTADYVNGSFEDMFIEMTTDVEVAQEWSSSGCQVVCRTISDGCNGIGITLWDESMGGVPSRIDGEDVVLYTKLFKNKREYRVFIATDGNSCNIINIYKKVVHRSKSAHGVDKKIRIAYDLSPTGVWAFVSKQLKDVDQAIIELAYNFMIRQWNKAIDDGKPNRKLSFCGMDVVYNEYYDRAKIVEVNTAAGIGRMDVLPFIDALRGL